MRHKSNKVTIDRTSGSRQALLRTLTISLITNGKITTTPVKAKAVRSFVEPMITKGKERNRESIRFIEQKLGNKTAAMKIVDDIAPLYKERAGGYTSMMKLALRKGDGAQQVLLQFVK